MQFNGREEWMSDLTFHAEGKCINLFFISSIMISHIGFSKGGQFDHSREDKKIAGC